MCKSECKCQNPESGGIKCPSQHIALCIRGKDRECYGECISIPLEYGNISEQFLIWSEITIKEKVIEHISSNRQLYIRNTEFKDIQHKFNEFDLSSKGKFIFRNAENEKLQVQYTFSFKSKGLNPNDNEMLMR